MRDKERYDTRTAVMRFIEENHLFSAGDRILVALSGGADSVALLHLLNSIKEKYRLSLYAAHFHHGIRGEEADRDEAFVIRLCGEWGIRLFCDRADVPAVAAETRESVELCGRRLRYAFFDSISAELGGAKIATAHHADDNAETVLWNLTRGAGLGGLTGIPVRRGLVIRPLLCCTREEIEAYCRGNHLDYVCDSTNLSDDYTRNRLRHQVMPVLRELNPSVCDSFSRTALLMQEADEYFNKISDKELKNAETTYGYSCEKLLRLELPVLRCALKNFLEKASAPVDFRHISLIIEAMRTGGAVNLGQGYSVVCAQGTLRLTDTVREKNGFCIPFGEYLKTGGVTLAVRGGTVDFSAVSGASDSIKIHSLLLQNCIPCDIISSDTVFRSRRAGDTFTDARRGVTKSLKKLMNELKIPREIRDTVPVVAEGSEILWLSGYGASARARVDLTRDGEIIYMGDSHA